MTKSELEEYYARLLILQYVGKPKAFATIKALVGPVIMDLLPSQIQDGFDLSTAVGVQLDTIGKYAGVTRGVNSSIGPINLGDSDFRNLIRIAIIRNMGASSLADIQSLLHVYFAGQVFVFDNANMHMNYVITGSVGSIDLARAFVIEGLLPKPMGVELATVIYVPTLVNMFGFRTYDTPNAISSPFNTYDNYHMDWPFLNYDDAITL